MIKVSIIIPVYRVEAYLKRCVDSVRNQTLQEIEIILVDDGSPDNCGKMCNEYALEDERIKVIHKENGGLSSARNAGMEIAMGEYISFVDSDDYIDLQMLEKMYQSAARSNSDMVGCGFYEMLNTGEWRTAHSNLPEGRYEHQEIVEQLVVHILGNDRRVGQKQREGYAWLNLYKKAIIDLHNLSFRSERVYYHEDEVFLLDFLLYANAVSFVDEPLYHYQFNGSSLSNSYRKTLWEMSKQLITAFREFSRAYGIEEECRRRVDLYMLSYVFYSVRNECHPVANCTRAQTIALLRKICEDAEVQRILQEPFPTEGVKTIFIVLKLVKGKHPGLIYLWHRIMRKRYYPSNAAGE